MLTQENLDTSPNMIGQMGGNIENTIHKYMSGFSKNEAQNTPSPIMGHNRIPSYIKSIPLIKINKTPENESNQVF